MKEEKEEVPDDVDSKHVSRKDEEQSSSGRSRKAQFYQKRKSRVARKPTLNKNQMRGTTDRFQELPFTGEDHSSVFDK